MDKAFALAASQPSDVSAQRDSDCRHVSFATWDEKKLSMPPEDDASLVRREQLKKFVTATMGGSVLILVIAMIRLAIGGSAQEEEIAHATFAKMRDVPAEIASLPRQISTLSARTQASMKVQQRRDSMKKTTARAAKFW